MSLSGTNGRTSTVERARGVRRRFRMGAAEVTASRWWVNGDHPEDGVGEEAPDLGTGGTYVRVEGAVVRFYRHPQVPREQSCFTCGQPMHEHGWIDDDGGDYTVCPGDWVVTMTSGRRFPMKAEIFDYFCLPADA